MENETVSYQKRGFFSVVYSLIFSSTESWDKKKTKTQKGCCHSNAELQPAKLSDRNQVPRNDINHIHLAKNRNMIGGLVYTLKGIH